MTDLTTQTSDELTEAITRLMNLRDECSRGIAERRAELLRREDEEGESE